MINKYRLKISYKENKITLDVDENITFMALSKEINEKLLLNKCSYFEFVYDGVVLDTSEQKNNLIIGGFLELDQELVYFTGKRANPYAIKIIVWDYVMDINDATMRKFVQLVKKVDQAKPKQKYYLNKGQRKFIDTALKDCYNSLTELNFGGEYSYQLLKNGDNYLTVKLTYYMLDDKYKIHLFENINGQKSKKTKYIVTFYDTNRAYFKGYQSVNRNAFILRDENETIKDEDFEDVYNALNRLTFMFKDVEDDYLFANHDKSLFYDIASRKYWIEK